MATTIGYSIPNTRPWGTVAAPLCVAPKPPPKPPVKLPEDLQLTRPKPWERISGFESTEITQLPEQPVTNYYVKPCFIPPGMSTEPIHYPNLVTGFERNPQHAARASLNVRYTDKDWTRNCAAIFAEAKKTRINCELVRADAIRLMRQTDEKTAVGQTDVKYRIKERITDMQFWRDELNSELEKVKNEIALLSEMQRNCSKSLQDLESLMHIAQECLRLREGRQGSEKERDLIEEKLLREVDNIQTSRQRFQEVHGIIERQLNDLRNAQHSLEEDVVHKETTLCIDRICSDLDNYSRGVNYRGGIEKTAKTISTAESWNEASVKRVENAQAARARSAELRASLGVTVTGIAVAAQQCFEDTNWAFERGQVKLTNELTRVQSNLSAVKEEKYQLDKYVTLLRKAIDDKMKPLMVAQTRLEARCHREGLELCEDFAHRRLVTEIVDIQDSIENLYHKLNEAESKYHQLLKTRNNLEEDLKRKVSNLFTDREKCMSLRRSFPIHKMIKY